MSRRSALVAVALVAMACESPAVVVAPPAALVRPAVEPAIQVRCPGGLLCEASATLCGWRVPAACDRRVEQPYVCSCRLVGAKNSEVHEFFASRYRNLRLGPSESLELERPQPPVFPGGPAPTAATLRVLAAAADGAERALIATPAGASVLRAQPGAASGKPIGVE